MRHSHSGTLLMTLNWRSYVPFLLPGFLCAQTTIIGAGPSGVPIMVNSDLAVLDAGEVRKDVPCSVSPVKPTLGFDLKFHAGYEVTFPMSDLAGAENMLTILFRIVKVNPAAPNSIDPQPTFFTQRIRVPLLEDTVKGDAFLQGAFDLGEGSYHVDWLMRDRAERVCADSWDIEAALTPKDRGIALVIAPGAVQRSEAEQFTEEPPVQRAQGEAPLNIKVLVNFAPQNALSAALQPIDTTALISILRGISRDPRIGKFSITAFNMQESKIVYRQSNADQIDFPALGKALDSLNLGIVDLKRLAEKHPDTNFLADLIHTEVASPGEQRPDAVIFAGPKVMLDTNVPQDALRQVGDVDFPVFYMNYNLYPQASPWKDAISHTVKYFRGTEYTISRPRDLWFAVSDLVTRVVKSRNGKRAAAISSH
jgi:hypothetical protein